MMEKDFFETQIESTLNIPPFPERSEGDKFQSFAIKIERFSIPYSGDKEEMESSKYQITMQLYDIKFHQFIGNQWTSQLYQGHLSSSEKFSVEVVESAYFSTSLDDLSVVLVIEILKENKLYKVSSLGWGIFRLFKEDRERVDIGNDIDSTPLQIILFRGSSRALFFIDEPIENNSSLEVIQNLTVSITVQTHQALEKVASELITENTLVHPDEHIPGINDSLQDPLKEPEILKFEEFVIEHVGIAFNPSLVEFETKLKNVLNKDRLARDNLDPEKDSGQMTISDRVLKIYIHNGWTYLEEEQIIHLSCEDGSTKKSRKHKRHSIETHSHGVRGDLTMHHGVDMCVPVCRDVSLVFVLEYTITEPKSKESQKMSPKSQHNVGIRWCHVMPFRNSINTDDLIDGFEISVDMKGGHGKNPSGQLFYRDSEKSPMKAILSAFVRKKPQDGTSILSSEKSPTDYYSERQSNREHQHYPPQPSSESVIKPPKAVPVYNKAPISQRSDETDLMIPTPRQQQPFDTSMLEFGTPRGLPMPAPHTAQMLLYSQLMRSMMGSNVPVVQDIGSYQPAGLTIPPYITSGAVLPIGLRTHTGHALSRTAYARLYSAGFPRILDHNGENAEVMDPAEDIKIDINAEINDSNQCNEIIFQFLAYTVLPEGEIDSRKLENVYFTFQFYRFPLHTTPRLHLHKPITDISTFERSEPYILQMLNKDSSVSDSLPGYQIKYNVDPDFLKSGEGRIFLEHLYQQTLHIDVWDGDSLILIGSAAVDLRHLCRQKRSAVQVSYELDVLPSADCGDDEFSNGIHYGTNYPIGRLHLRMGNVGYRSGSQAALKSVFVPEKKRTFVETTDSSKFLGGSLTRSTFGDSNWLETVSQPKHVVRAQSALSSDRELATLIATRHNKAQDNYGITENGNSTVNGDDVLYGQGDADKRRKLSRMAAVRQAHPECEPPNPTTISILSYREDKNQRMRDLRTIDIYREKSKRENIKRMLSSGVCAQHHLYPSFGSTEFFEFELKNPFNTPHNVVIDFQDPINSDRECLSPVVDGRQLRALKLMYNVTTPIEDDVIQWDQSLGRYTVFLKPKEKVLIPLRYVELNYTSGEIGQGPSDQTGSPRKHISNSITDERTIKVIFHDIKEDKLIGQLEVHIARQPVIVDQSFRFYHPEQSFLKKVIRMPPVERHLIQQFADPNQDSILVYTRCSDSSVVCESKPVYYGEPHDVFIKVSCGSSPQVRQFLVAVYIDPFMLRPAQIWQFTVHSQQRIDVACVEFQSTRVTLLVKGSGATRNVKIYTSHPRECVVSPSGPLLLAAGAVHEVQAVVCPSRPGSRLYHIHVVDCEFHQLIKAWLICAQVKSPEISKLLEVNIPVGGGQACNKRVAYNNPYPHSKSYTLLSDRPDLLSFKSNEITVGGGDTINIGLRFLPHWSERGIQQIRIFMNDEEGKNEETFGISAHYT